MTGIDTAWLEAFYNLFAINHNDACMRECLPGCCAGPPPREAALRLATTTTWSATMPKGELWLNTYLKVSAAAMPLQQAFLAPQRRLSRDIVRP